MRVSVTKRWAIVLILGCCAMATHALGQQGGEEAPALEVVSFSGKAQVDLEKDVFWVKDPESGRLRAPSMEEMARIAPNHRLTRSTKNLGEIHYSDGSSGNRPAAGFEHMMLVRRNAEGEMETTCVTTMAQALDFLSGAAEKRREVTYDR